MGRVASRFYGVAFGLFNDGSAVVVFGAEGGEAQTIADRELKGEDHVEQKVRAAAPSL